MYRCPKRVINGPCGGYRDSKCEVNGTCVFIEVFSRLNNEIITKIFYAPILDNRFRIRDYFPVIKRPLTNFYKRLLNGDRLIVYEVVLPLGRDLNTIISDLKAFKGNDIVLAVTDSPLGIPSYNPFLISKVLMDETDVGDIVVNIALRDRTLSNLLSDVATLISVGIRNFLIVTGDWPRSGTAFFELDSTRAIYALRLFTDLGINVKGSIVDVPRQAHYGAIANPNSKYKVIEVLRTMRKVIAGAEFLIFQPVYNANTIKEFVSELTDELTHDIPLIPSYAPILSAKHLEGLKSIGIVVYNKELVELIKKEDYELLIEKNIDLILSILSSLDRIRALYLSTYGDINLGYRMISELRKYL